MQVTPVYDGNYAVSYILHQDKDEVELLSMIIDPTVVFDVDTTYRTPSGFYNLQDIGWNMFLMEAIHAVQCSDSDIFRLESVNDNNNNGDSGDGDNSDISSDSGISHNDGVTVIRVGNDHVGSTIGIKKLVDDRNAYTTNSNANNVISNNAISNNIDNSTNNTNLNPSPSQNPKCRYKVPGSIRKLLLESFTKQPQLSVSQTPCAFAATTATLTPGTTIKIVSIYGHAESIDVYNRDIANVIKEKSFSERKLNAARAVVNTVVNRVEAGTSDNTLNLYVKQVCVVCV